MIVLVDDAATRRRRRRSDHDNIGARSFAEVVDGRLVEVRLDLLREAQSWLGEYERSRDPEARGRLLQTLEILALLVRV